MVTCERLVAGSLGKLSADVVDYGALGKDPCRVGARSSFTRLGKAGLRPTSSGMLRPQLSLNRLAASGSRNAGQTYAYLRATADCR